MGDYLDVDFAGVMLGETPDERHLLQPLGIFIGPLTCEQVLAQYKQVIRHCHPDKARKRAGDGQTNRVPTFDPSEANAARDQLLVIAKNKACKAATETAETAEQAATARQEAQAWAMPPPFGSSSSSSSGWAGPRLHPYQGVFPMPTPMPRTPPEPAPAPLASIPCSCGCNSLMSEKDIREITSVNHGRKTFWRSMVCWSCCKCARLAWTKHTYCKPVGWHLTNSKNCYCADHPW